MIKLGEYYVAREHIAALRADLDSQGRHLGVLIWITGRVDPIQVPGSVDDVLRAIRAPMWE